MRAHLQGLAQRLDAKQGQSSGGRRILDAAETGDVVHIRGSSETWQLAAIVAIHSRPPGRVEVEVYAAHN